MIEPGQPAPDFTHPDQDGEDVTLSSLRGGPVVV
jgi:peroxiredoxin Q/BCP